jgi:hypothetical protein
MELFAIYGDRISIHSSRRQLLLAFCRHLGDPTCDAKIFHDSGETPVEPRVVVSEAIQLVFVLEKPG